MFICRRKESYWFYLESKFCFICWYFKCHNRLHGNTRLKLFKPDRIRLNTSILVNRKCRIIIHVKLSILRIN